MDSANKLHIQLLLDSDDNGRVLFNHELFPIAHNAQFEQFCGKFFEKTRVDNLGIPEKLMEKIKNANLPPGKKISSIIASDNTEFIVSVKTILFHSEKFISVSLYPRRLRDMELFLRLKDHYGITEREFHIICFVKKGWTNKEIADELKMSVAAVKMHLSRIYNEKFNVANRAELVGVLEDFLES